MTDREQIIHQMTRTNELLSVISQQLERLIAQTAPVGPDYRVPLAGFKNFDWTNIGAEVVASDQYGVSAVTWNGYLFKRRSGDGKYGQAIWFSRAVGKSSEGETDYVRLISFKGNGKVEAEPVPFRA